MFKAGLDVEILLLQLLDCLGVPRAASHLRPIGGGRRGGCSWRSEDACRGLVSSTMWTPEMGLRSSAWLQVLSPTKPSHQSP